MLLSNGLSYQIKKSFKARNLRITVYPDERVIVTIPVVVSNLKAQKYLIDNYDWVQGKLKYFRNINKNFPKKSKPSPLELKLIKEQALKLAVERVKYYADFYKVNVKKLIIRNQKTRWGSCSKNGTLSFNYKVALLSSELAEYIFVHEVCHLREFNHSKRFWGLVEITVPDYVKIRKKLKKLNLN